MRRGAVCVELITPCLTPLRGPGSAPLLQPMGTGGRGRAAAAPGASARQGSEGWHRAVPRGMLFFWGGDLVYWPPWKAAVILAMGWEGLSQQGGGWWPRAGVPGPLASSLGWCFGLDGRASWKGASTAVLKDIRLDLLQEEPTL